MSRIPLPQSKGVPPKTGGIPRPSESFRPTASSTMRETASGSKIKPPSATGMSQMTSKSSVKKSSPGAKEKRESVKFPALSVFKPNPTDVSELDKLRKKTARRNAPEGEDIKMIREIMRNVKDQEITVHEFVGLVAPYTADNGTILRTVLATELSNFRSLSRKIYDNMTQDVSDVLTNEHIQLTESSKERYSQYTDKMMRAIDEIYEYCPNFDFEQYYTDPEYIEKMFTMAHELIMDEDQEQVLLRQEAYHRMMWLRSEGERLSAENKKLQQRFQELKKRQKDEMKRASMIDKQNEEKRKELEATQDTLQEQLEDMNNSIEQALVTQEMGLAEDQAAEVPPPPPPTKKSRLPPTAPKAKTRQPENWNVKAAAAIEESITTDAVIAESSRVSVASSKSSTGAVPKVFRSKKEKKKKRSAKPPRVPQDSSPFHYSPPRTPPERAQQQTSPFHYSPPRSPSREQRAQAEAMETTRVTTTTRTIEQPSAISGLPRFRRAQAPKDTWKGFA